MCDNIQQHAEHWPSTKLHRWIGFVQAGMMANRMLDLDGAKAMFDKAKNAFGEIKEDHDLVDHLDHKALSRWILVGRVDAGGFLFARQRGWCPSVGIRAVR
jgi:hypothetical protein